MATIDEDIKNFQIILYVSTKEDYGRIRSELLGSAGHSFDKPCLISNLKPYNSVINDLKEMEINDEKFFFIDTITKTVQEPPQIENCAFIESPTALTDISLALSDAFNERGCDVCIVDTISALIVYQDKNSVIKFVHNLVTKARVSEKKAILIALKEDGEEFIKDISMFIDKLIES